MRKIKYRILDVFTKDKFGGNQLAVFPEAGLIPTNQFQLIANELNLSETVFIIPSNGNAGIPMRIFTPAKELPTAGHPTIGAAYCLAENLPHPKNGNITINFIQKVGKISVEVKFMDNQIMEASMISPNPEFLKVIQDREVIADLLSISPFDFLDFPIEIVSCGVPYLMVPVKSLEIIGSVNFRVDLWNLAAEQLDHAFLYVFCPKGKRSGSDLHGRMFSPGLGIIEDPATGSANGPLAAYCWKYNIKKGPLVSEQGFEIGRPSLLNIQAFGKDGKIEKVTVAGCSVFVGEGLFYVD